MKESCKIHNILHYPDKRIILAEEPYTCLEAEWDMNNCLKLIAYGDYDAVYYPKYCPECGKKVGD